MRPHKQDGYGECVNPVAVVEPYLRYRVEQVQHADDGNRTQHMERLLNEWYDEGWRVVSIVEDTWHTRVYLRRANRLGIPGD